MFAPAHPEVLSVDWLPPTLTGRGMALAEATRHLVATVGGQPPTRILGVVGPEGAGSSTVARSIARNWISSYPRSSESPAPRLLAVRVRPLRGIASVAGALIRHFDAGFEPRGFPAMEVLAGCLRRIRRTLSPSAIVFDDLDAGAPPIGPLVRAIANPADFLPEGEDGLPRMLVVVAGTGFAVDRVARAGRLAFPRIVLAAYGTTELRRIVEDRIVRALGREVPLGMAERVADRALEEGRGASRAIDLVRREILGGPRARSIPGGFPPRHAPPVSLEPHLLNAIELATHDGATTVGALRRQERQNAAAARAASLPDSTFWRRLVRLERAGYLRREVRPGGLGGTRSMVRLLRPVTEWVTDPRTRGIPRAIDSLFGGARPVPVGTGRTRAHGSAAGPAPEPDRGRTRPTEETAAPARAGRTGLRGWTPGPRTLPRTAPAPALARSP